MAQAPTNTELEKVKLDQELSIEAKRELTGDPNWTPQGDDPNHGPGMMPEEVWKQFSPNSKEETDPDKIENILNKDEEDNNG
jgi:hypothetical protein